MEEIPTPMREILRRAMDGALAPDPEYLALSAMCRARTLYEVATPADAPRALESGYLSCCLRSGDK